MPFTLAECKKAEIDLRLHFRLTVIDACCWAENDLCWILHCREGAHAIVNLWQKYRRRHCGSKLLASLFGSSPADRRHSTRGAQASIGQASIPHCICAGIGEIQCSCLLANVLCHSKEDRTHFRQESCIEQW
jgi:hypothetical protein